MNHGSIMSHVSRLTSIIVPAYNSASRIELTLNSIVSQSCPEYEIIIVNDASTDSTEDIARKFLEEHNCRFQIIRHEKNLGVSAARNTGLKAANGEYIWFVDSDDLAEKNFLTLMRGKAEKEKADIVLSGYIIRNEINNKSKCRNIKLNSSSARDCFPAFLKRKIPSNIWCCFFRKGFLDECGLSFHEGCHFGEDEEFLVKALIRSNKTCFVRQPLYILTIYEKVENMFKPRREGEDWLTQCVHSYWRTVKYVLRYSEDQRERKYAVNFYLPQIIVRQFTIYARLKDEVSYNKCQTKLKHRKIREILLSTIRFVFVMPELTFKALMLLFFPKIYYVLKK